MAAVSLLVQAQAQVHVQVLVATIEEESSTVTATMTATTTAAATTTTTTIPIVEGAESTGRVRRRGRLEVRREGLMVVRTNSTVGPKSAGAPLLRVSTVPENALSQTLQRTLLRRQLPKAKKSFDRNHVPQLIRHLPSPRNSFDRNNVPPALHRSRTSLLQKLSDHASSTLHTASTTLRLRPEEPAADASQDPQDPLLKAAEQFAYSQQDIVSILRDREAFETLKKSLRQRSCVTNAYLKLNVHFYVQHVKQVRLARHHHNLRGTTAATAPPPSRTISIAAA